MKEVSCDLCGSNAYTVKFEIDISPKNLRYYRYCNNIPDPHKMTGLNKIVQCNNCDLLYTNPRFTTDELEVVYSSDKIIGGNWKNFPYLFNKKYDDELQGQKRKNTYKPNLNKWRFDIIEKYINKDPKDLKLIDIGCGNGKFVYDAKQRDYQAKGIDLSPDRIKQGKELFDLNDTDLECKNINGFELNEKYDIIVLWDVIEHVESPSEILQSLKKIAHPKTLIFMLTMSIDSITYKLYKKDWNYINPSQHLHYFSHNTMKNMMEKNGFIFTGVELDNSKQKNLIHFTARIVIGQINQFFFKIYTRKSPIRHVFKLLHPSISEERILKRLENIFPGKYIGRYHDNFVFIGKSSS